jgi:hypothetical protein
MAPNHIFPRKSLMLLSREFGSDVPIACFVPQRDGPGAEENIRNSFHEFNRVNISTSIKTDFPPNLDSTAVMQRHISAIAEGSDGELDRILSELEKMTQLIKQPSNESGPTMVPQCYQSIF